jgi:PAS domain S-box-containing protein
MKTPNTLFVITDVNLNIVENDNEFIKIFLNEDKKLEKNLKDYFPNLKNRCFDKFHRLNSNMNCEYYIKQSSIKINNSEYYIFIIADFLMINEIEKQVSYLNREKYIYNEMLNKLEDGIYITDNLGKTLYVNDAFLNLSGLSKDMLIGKFVQKLNLSNVLPNSCCEKVIETHQTVTTINNYYKGQKCLVTGSMINDDKGKFKRTIAVVRDVSELDILMNKVAKNEKLSFFNSNSNIYVKKIEKNEYRNEESGLLVSSNEKVKEIYRKALKFSNVDTSILILGETGVGKDYLVSYIHNSGEKRLNENLIKINCSAIPEHLIESELFGYVDGAFTGAKAGGKKGLFEEAGNGTVFLDEIGEMPYMLQVKLLNVLNDKYFYRIGATKRIPMNARVLAATNADIKKMIVEKKFRADLFYRLNVINLTLPPLRERKEDIISLAQFFLEFYNNHHSLNCYFSPECLKDFLIYKWPGNIREMKNLTERLVLISEDVCIDSKLFREQIGEWDEVYDNEIITDLSELSLKEKLGIYEEKLIIDAIKNEETLKKAAVLLGIDISTLVRKKQKYNL